MKKLIYFLSFGLVWMLAVSGYAQSFNLASYNIRYDSKQDTANAWSNRLPHIANIVKLHGVDVMGTQEGLRHQLEDLKRALDGYTYIGVGREDGKEKGEFSAIFYLEDKFQLLQSGTFWLSSTPDKPGKGWDAALPRVCTWGLFKDRASGANFYVYNLHLDHKGEGARKESAKQVLAKIKAQAAGTPVVLLGDFNFDQTHENYNLLNTSVVLKDAFTQAKVRFAPNGTFNGFDIDRKSDARIDHIFVTSQFQVNKYGVLTYTYGPGKYPSDHFPVVVEVTLKKK